MEDAWEIRISLLASGAILLDGQPVDLSQLDSRLAQSKPRQDQVLLYKEDLSPNGTPQSMEVVKLVIKHKLAVSFSTKADFSDCVDRFGQSQPRSTAPAAGPSDRYAPSCRMSMNGVTRGKCLQRLVAPPPRRRMDEALRCWVQTER